MRNINGTYNDDLTVTSYDGTIVVNGRVVGSVAVDRGGKLILHGTVTKDVHVLVGGRAAIRGTIDGFLVVDGEADVWGVIRGGAHERAGGKLTVNAGAAVGNDRPRA